MTKSKSNRTWFGRDPENGKWYWGGWEINIYIPTTKTNYLINIFLTMLLILIFAYQNYQQNPHLSVRDYVIQTLGIGLLVFFFSYRMIEVFLTGRYIWRIFDIWGGSSAKFAAILHLLLLLVFFLILGGYIHV